MKRLALNAITCVPSWPGYLLAMIFIYILRCDAHWDGVIVVVHAPKIKWWNFSTTIGHAIFLKPDADINVLEHEKVHARRFQNNAVVAFMLACTAAPMSLLYAFSTWLSAITWPLFGYLVAWLRGERIYEDADDEVEARAVSAQRVSQLP
jgi:hypothetical protein